MDLDFFSVMASNDLDVFISWSGDKSRAVAEALRDWLPKLVNAIKPWISSADIDKGTRWRSEIAERLSATKAGIVCLTPTNLTSPWLLFEAGALSKSIESAHVCTLLVGLEPTDVMEPLAQFQATKANKDDILRLVKTLNSALGADALPDSHIQDAFEAFWPRLEQKLNTLPEEGATCIPRRSEREMLEEVLELVRGLSRTAPNPLAVALRERIASRVQPERPPVIPSSSARTHGRNVYREALIGLGARFEESLPDEEHDKIMPVVLDTLDRYDKNDWGASLSASGFNFNLTIHTGKESHTCAFPRKFTDHELASMIDDYIKELACRKSTASAASK